MIIDITKLRSGLEDYIEVDETYSFTKEELENTEIIELNNVKVEGEILKNSMDEYIVDIDVFGTMVLPCSISLKPTNYDFNTKIEGNIAEIYEEFGENFKNDQKTIDILPIIWENILMEIPMKVISDDTEGVVTKGDGWELLTEED